MAVAVHARGWPCSRLFTTAHFSNNQTLCNQSLAARFLATTMPCELLTWSVVVKLFRPLVRTTFRSPAVETLEMCILFWFLPVHMKLRGAPP